MRRYVISRLLFALIGAQLVFHYLLQSETLVSFCIGAFGGVVIAWISSLLPTLLLTRQKQAAAVATLRRWILLIFFLSFIGAFIALSLGGGFESFGGAFGAAMTFMAVPAGSTKVENNAYSRRKKGKRRR